jgi:RNA polymerase sigma-70 factor (ECF subfamily)
MYASMGSLFLDRCRTACSLRLVRDEGDDRTAVDSTLPTLPALPRWARVTPEQFAGAVAALPPDFGRLFRLHALEGQSYDDIGAALGITPKSVATLLLRTRLLLKDILLDLVDEEESA